MPMATKLGRMVTYRDSLSTIKSFDHIITWLCEITTAAYGHKMWQADYLP